MIFFRLILDTHRRDADSGVVDQYVESAERLQAEGDGCGPLRCVCDVEADPRCLLTEL